jgi:hypothetical protein
MLDIELVFFVVLRTIFESVVYIVAKDKSGGTYVAGNRRFPLKIDYIGAEIQITRT